LTGGMAPRTALATQAQAAFVLQLLLAEIRQSLLCRSDGPFS
jgi:hypothetical protein